MSNGEGELIKESLALIRELKEDLAQYQEPIAIIGMGCRLPGGANNPNAYWELLSRGGDAITEIPATRWDADAFYDPDPKAPGKMITKLGGFLNIDVSQFDANFFGINPKEAEYLDPQQRLLLEVSYEAILSAGIMPESLKGSLTGVFIGICTRDYWDLLTARGDKELINRYIATGNAHSTATGRISFVLGLRGPNFAVDTACSSSLVAIDEACQSLRNGNANLALAGGVNLILGPDIPIDLSKAGMLATDGHCKTFDASADGYVRGEGCGIIVLKRLSDAKRDGNIILGIIKSSSVNQDGASSGLTVPNGDAQETLIRKTLSKAQLKGSEIDYVEAHGTGTALGDPIEVRAIGATYGERDASDPLKLASVKTNIGHLEGAAGVASLIKVILALQHEILPKHLHFTKLNPRIDLNFPVEIITQNQVWKRGERIRRAAVSSFGFSGTNAHLILEEGPVLSVEELALVEKRFNDTPKFERQRFWAEEAAPIMGRKLDRVHPLLGEKISTPEEETIYQGELNLSELPYLKDHQVYGHIIYPGAAYLEMMLAAGLNVLGEGKIHLKDVSIEAALSFEAGKSVETQVLMKPNESGYGLAVYSHPRWQCHARGLLRFSEPEELDSVLNLEDIKSRCQTRLSQDIFYAELNTSGIVYGTHFQGLKTIYVGKREALGELSLSVSSKGYLAHPSLLDGALQLLAVSLREEQSKDLYLPVGCDEMEFYKPFGDQVFAHWQETEKTEMGRSGNLSFCTSDGKILAKINGMHYRKTTEQSLKQMLAHESGVEEWFYEWHWQEKSLENTVIPSSLGHWLVLSDGPVSDELVKLFERNGASIHRISSNEHPKTKEAFIELLKSDNYKGILHAASTGDRFPLTARHIAEAQALGSKSLLHLVQALVELEENLKIPLFLITKNITSSNVAQSPLNGLFKTLLLERPELALKHIDLADEWDSSLLMQAIFAKNNESIFAVKKNQCFVGRLLKINKSEIQLNAENKIQGEATYLITGGAGGLGLTLSKWLIENGARHLVLSGRRALDKEIQANLKSLENQGAKIIYESLDIGDEKSVENLISRLQENEKPLKGIFHLAGVLEDAMLMEQDWDDFEKVFRPKIYGSFYLHQYSKDLDYFVTFSSFASILGNPGQSNYAAANAFMDSLCEYRKQEGLAAHSLSWGPWAEVGMAKTIISRHAKNGVSGLNPSEGIRALELALLLPKAHLSIAKINWKLYFGQLLEPPAYLEAFALKEASRENLLEQLEGLASQEAWDVLINYVMEILRGVLGLASSVPIDEKKGFFDMGLDSLMAVELRNRLQLGLGKTLILPTTLVFDYSNLQKMTQYIGQLLKLEEASLKPSVDIKEEIKKEKEALIQKQAKELSIEEILEEIKKEEER